MAAGLKMVENGRKSLPGWKMSEEWQKTTEIVVVRKMSENVIKNVGKNFSRNTRRQFSAKVNFAHLISYESQKSDFRQTQPRKAIKSGFTRQLWKFNIQLMGLEGYLWPKKTKKEALNFSRFTRHLPTTNINIKFSYNLQYIYYHF